MDVSLQSIVSTRYPAIRIRIELKAALMELPGNHFIIIVPLYSRFAQNPSFVHLDLLSGKTLVTVSLFGSLDRYRFKPESSALDLSFVDHRHPLPDSYHRARGAQLSPLLMNSKNEHFDFQRLFAAPSLPTLFCPQRAN